MIIEIHPYEGPQWNVGLCNKLRAIISSIKYCEDNDYKLNIYWDMFYELFPNILDNELFTREPGDIIVNPLFYPIGQENNKRGGFPGNSDVKYYSKDFPFKRIFNMLKPEQKIIDKIQYYSTKFKIEQAIGVHLRLGDFSNYSKENNLYLPSIDDYCFKLDTMLNENDYFYFTSDDENSYIKMKQRYSKNVLFIENKNLNRSDNNNFIDAYLDINLLSKCKIILGNPNSTFSYHAARIGDKSLIYCEQ